MILLVLLLLMLRLRLINELSRRQELIPRTATILFLEDADVHGQLESGHGG
jgi:hypothetical protein